MKENIMGFQQISGQLVLHIISYCMESILTMAKVMNKFWIKSSIKRLDLTQRLKYRMKAKISSRDAWHVNLKTESNGAKYMTILW